MMTDKLQKVIQAYGLPSRLKNQAMLVSTLTKPDEHQEDNATGQKPAATKQITKLLSRFLDRLDLRYTFSRIHQIADLGKVPGS